MLYSLILFADDVAKQVGDKQEPGPIWTNPMFMIMILMAAFFFIVILPGQRRRQREQEQLMAGMKKNDEVVTASGIIGIVYNIKEGSEEVVLKIDDNARIRVLKSSIVRIIKKDETPATPAAAAPTTTTDTSIKPS
ncbi:MAG TPA: preprotein translocase subunit YajC [Gemmataceae bacterium]|nr:preprotein translocase subunit YajC [Gemmataceae bacterium]